MIFHVQTSNVKTVFCPDSERHLKQEKGGHRLDHQKNMERAAGSATTATNNINKHKVIKQDTRDRFHQVEVVSALPSRVPSRNY
jgi:hypothetical protein